MNERKNLHLIKIDENQSEYSGNLALVIACCLSEASTTIKSSAKSAKLWDQLLKVVYCPEAKNIKKKRKTRAQGLDADSG